MPLRQWKLLSALLSLAVLATPVPGQQVEELGSGSAFDTNQWNAAIARPAPRFDLRNSGEGLLAWADPAARSTVRQQALAVLGLAATGSTMRSGPHRRAVKQVVIGWRAEDWSRLSRGERILLTFAVHEVATASASRLLDEFADDQAWSLRQQLANDVALALPAMDLLLLHLLVRQQDSRRDGAEVAEQLRLLARAASCSDKLGSHRRTDAAWLLVRRLRGEAVPDDLLLAVCWPANPLADPQHTWLGVTAAGEVTAAARAPLLPQLERLFAARNPATADLPASWEAGNCGDRIEATAWHLQTLHAANRLLAMDARAAAAATESR